ncbi:MAG: hypothetical protein QGF09_13510 [Rhodospirillales bacterium]|nr:hypothetical protein [Rhodospirillales bacterium]
MKRYLFSVSALALTIALFTGCGSDSPTASLSGSGASFVPAGDNSQPVLSNNGNFTGSIATIALAGEQGTDLGVLGAVLIDRGGQQRSVEVTNKTRIYLQDQGGQKVQLMGFNDLEIGQSIEADWDVLSGDYEDSVRPSAAEIRILGF